MECVGLPNREVDSGSMVPLNCTTQGGPVHIVAAFTLAQQGPGTQTTFPFSSPCLSWLDFFWSWLHPHSWREASFTQLGRCPQQPQAYLSLWGMGHPNWIGPGLGQGLTPVAGGLGYCIWQHFQKHGTGKKQFSVFTGWWKGHWTDKKQNTHTNTTTSKQNKCFSWWFSDL